MAAQSLYPLPFTILVSLLTSPSYSTNTLLMFAAFPLFVTFYLMMPLKSFSVLLLCHVWITVMLCLLVLQNTSLKNSRKFRIMLLDSSSIAPNLIMSPLLHILHWLNVHMRIDYKISSLCFNVLESTAPSYLSDLLHVYTPPPPPHLPSTPQQLRSSSDDRLFSVPHARTKSYGQRSFDFQGANTWNQLPLSVRHSQSLASFKTKLKTHLFPK